MASFFHLDRLIRACYRFHREAWIAAGSPYFIGAPERLGLRSHLAWMCVAMVWPLRSPAWIQLSPEHRRRLRLVRRCVLAWNLSVVILALGIGYFAGR